MSTLVAFFLRIVVFGVLTFAFVVLFEHGVAGYKEGIPVEWDALKSFVSAKLSGTPEAPAPTPTPAPVATPTPAVAEPSPEQPTPPPATPPPTPAPGADISSWQKLQGAPIGGGAEKPAN
ncbi:hypothetical protein BH09VER1_BH09VER1_32320 [soil metagenome]